MTEENTALQTPPSDPEAMKALTAKAAKIKKILIFFDYGQCTIAVILLILAFMPAFCGSRELRFGFLMLVPFFTGLANLAFLTGKDLTSVKVAVCNTSISQLGFFLVAVYGFMVFHSYILAGLAVTALIIGGLALMLIFQTRKDW